MPTGLPDFSTMFSPAQLRLGSGGGGGSPGFNINPSATSGSGTAYGRVPGAIGLPPNRYQQTAGVVPNLPNLTGGASNVVGAELGGVLSQDTLNALKSAAAEFGVSSGMGPGSGLANNKLFANIAGFSENRQRQGVQDYLSLLTGVGAQQTSPELAANIAERNANMAAAPDPAAAAAEQLRLYDMYYNRGRSGAGTPFNETWVGRNNPAGILAPIMAGPGGVLPTSSAGGGGYEGPRVGFNIPEPNDPYANWSTLSKTWGVGPNNPTPGTGRTTIFNPYELPRSNDYAPSGYTDSDVDAFLNDLLNG